MTRRRKAGISPDVRRASVATPPSSRHNEAEVTGVCVCVSTL